MMGMGEEPRNIYKAKTKEKSPVWFALPVYEKKMEAEYFSVSKNKPDLP